MSVEDELPHLLEELANDHVVGEPPAFEAGAFQSPKGDRTRPARFTIVAVAACSAVLIGGLVAINSGGDDRSPAATRYTNPETTLASSTGSSTASPTSDVAAPQRLGLIRIDAQSTSAGTTEVGFVFDNDLPEGDAVPIDDLASPPSDQVGYATQTSDGRSGSISVCGNAHQFPPPGIRTVDVFVPSDWFDPSASFEPSIAWGPDSAPPAKIVVCEPLNGTVQISIWGSASARIEDIVVSVDERTITVEIAPDPAGPLGETAEDDSVPLIDPLTRPLVAITDKGDAVYVPENGAMQVLLYDGPDPDDASSLGDGPNAVDRVAFGAGENRFVVGLCCAPVVGQIVTARPDDLPIPNAIEPPSDQAGDTQLAFDSYGYAPALDPNGGRQASIIGREVFVIDAADDASTSIELPDRAGDLWDLVWSDLGIIVLGRTESTWTLSTVDYHDGQIELVSARNFATFSDFDDLRFAGTAVDNEIAVHDLGTDTVLSGTIDDYGNNNGDERGSSLQVVTLPSPARSAWFHDPGQLIWVDMNRTLRVGDQVIPGQYTWARR